MNTAETLLPLRQRSTSVYASLQRPSSDRQALALCWHRQLLFSASRLFADALLCIMVTSVCVK